VLQLLAWVLITVSAVLIIGTTYHNYCSIAPIPILKIFSPTQTTYIIKYIKNISYRINYNFIIPFSIVFLNRDTIFHLS